jgi:hypothetical protein
VGASTTAQAIIIRPRGRAAFSCERFERPCAYSAPQAQQNRENTVGHEQKRAEILRQILLDKGVEYGDRSDALTALSELNPEFLESVLLNMARDGSEHEYLVEDAGDALGLMWVKLGQIPIAKVRGMLPPALKMIVAHLKVAAQ